MTYARTVNSALRVVWGAALVLILAGALALGARSSRLPHAFAEELKVPDNVPTDRFDLETKSVQGWTVVAGQWAVEDECARGQFLSLLLRHDNLTIRGVTGGG